MDLRKAGVYRYMEDPTTSLLNKAWKIVNVPTPSVGFWRPGMAAPTDLLSFVALGGRVLEQNAIFERLAWNLQFRRWFPDASTMTIGQMSCTLARAAAHGLPQSLEQLGAALRLDMQKNMEGNAAMLQLSKPKGWTPEGEPIFWERTDPEAEHLYSKLDVYVMDDVIVTEQADKAVPELSERERAVWELDQEINDRGIPLDVERIARTRKLCERVQALEGRRLWELTGGKVSKVSQAQKIAKWITERGLPTTSVAADVLDELKPVAHAFGMDDVVQVMEIRDEAGKSSVKKLDAMMAMLCRNGRTHGTLQYHGAGPGRWAGRGWQPQNVVRVDAERDGPTVAAFLELAGYDMDTEVFVEVVDCMLGPPIKAAALSLRGMVKASPGHKLMGGDFSNIEGRIGADFGDEQWKLDAFREYDEGTGPDLYKVAVARSFGTPVEEVDKTERQLGKVQELALGFQGGVKAFMSMAAVYRIDLQKILPIVYANTSQHMWQTAADKYNARDAYGLPADLWTALKVLVMSWRKGHPGIVKGWYDLQDAAIAAVANPGIVFECVGGRMSYLSNQAYLFCKLPCGRVIAYASPWLAYKEKRTPHPGYEHILEEDLDDTNSVLERRSKQVLFKGMVLGQWRTKALYGGLQWENGVQGTARDVMVDAMFRAGPAGYPIILTVHDELLTEVPVGFGSVEEFERILIKPQPTYLPKMPLSASAFESERYDK